MDCSSEDSSFGFALASFASGAFVKAVKKSFAKAPAVKLDSPFRFAEATPDAFLRHSSSVGLNKICITAPSSLVNVDNELSIACIASRFRS